MVAGRFLGTGNNYSNSELKNSLEARRDSARSVPNHTCDEESVKNDPLFTGSKRRSIPQLLFQKIKRGLSQNY